MKRILTVVGARPQFIKAAVVSRALASCKTIAEKIVHTGQHYDRNLSDTFFQDLEIPPPAWNLGIGSGPHGFQTGRMLEKLEQVMLEYQPDCVLVYGDTNSTLAGALAAAKLAIPVAHVEAGLRSFNRRMPEEVNRIVTDHLSSLLFAPTPVAVENLKAEGIAPEWIHLTGDVMYDAALQYGEKADRKSRILERFGLKSGRYILATIHRPENTDSFPRLSAITYALVELASELPVVFPLHPRTQASLDRAGLLSRLVRHVLASEPVGYLDMVALERNARLIITDSGGVQKEAYFCRVPCITVRDETEWVELVEAGWNRCVPPGLGAQRILGAIREWLGSFSPPVAAEGLYGEGKASHVIRDILAEAWPTG